MSNPSEITNELIARQIAEYADPARQKLYGQIAELVKAQLQDLADRCAHGAVAFARPKRVPSFAEKLLRKRKYKDALREVTDLVGARIVCEFESDVQAVCRAIRQQFDKAIDEVNSLDQRSLLRAGEFGYRSVHYVIELRREHWPELTEEMGGVKIEIQVRTRLQHIWSDLGHDRVYKSPFTLPDAIKREVSRIAAQFESLDEEFERVVRTIADYRAHFGAYLDQEGHDRETRLQQALRPHDPANEKVPLRLAELAISTDAWSDAIRSIRDFQQGHPELPSRLKAALGFALCQEDLLNRRRPEFAEGLSLMRQATSEEPGNVMHWVRLAACLDDEHDRLGCFQKAYRADCGDPVALAGLLESHMNTTNNALIVPLVRPAIREAFERCERQIATKVDLPWAHFRAGWFSLLLAEDGGAAPEEDLAREKHRRDTQLNTALRHYLRGIALTRPSLDSTPIKLALKAANALLRVQPGRLDAQIAVLLLDLVLHLRGGGTALQDWLIQHATAEQRAEIRARGKPARGDRVCIVVGTAKTGFSENREEYRRILGQVLAGFRGTVISGGTEQGIPGLVGEIGCTARPRIRTVGYLPAGFDSTLTSTRDARYDEHRRTTGARFSQLEPLQSWIDLLASGVQPQDVTVFGMGGGRIAAFEYRLALVLGARVGVIADSGREAEILANDPDWRGPAWRLQRLPFAATDAATMGAFMNPPRERPGFDYEQLGRLVHENYIADNRDSLLPKEVTDWARIGEELQRANREQIMAAPDILASEGYELAPLPPDAKPPPPPYLGDNEAIERMARLEHGRWLCERLSRGWSYEKGKPRDNVRKVHPLLVAWDLLSPADRQKDIDVIRNYGRVFAAAGFAIVRQPVG